MHGTLGNRYEIKEKIGGGGMAIVYLAEDTFLGREVAVKVLREQYTEDPEFVRHFHKEARAVATLNHNNIVRIYDFDANSTPIYLVMEFVEGPTLKQVINEEGRLSAKQAAKIAIQVADGLGEAHRNHIVHKDVKSHNILFDPNGIVKITDFGISQMLSNTTITHNKGILGSAHYFSPEQARGEHVSFKSDIYSLGIVMYEMLTGRVPFTGDNPVTVALKHIQENPPLPSEFVSDIPPEMENIIMTCLNKDPDSRFASMAALATALKAALDHDMKLGKPLAAGYVARQSELANESIALPRDLTQKTNGEAQAQPEEEDKRRRNAGSILIYTLIILLAALATIFIVRQFLNPSEVTVPSVENLTYESAANTLHKNDLEIDILKEAPHDTIEAGKVISQDPQAGLNVKPGRVVQVVLSTGKEAVVVPDLKNQTREEANNTLQALDLRLGTETEEYSNTVEKGRIIRQTQATGQKVAKDSAVDVVVSLGVEIRKVNVPDLRGQSLADAKNILQNSGLTMGTSEEVFHDSVNEGLVVSQSLEPGQSVNEGTRIVLAVSKGPNESQRPKPDDTPSQTHTQTISFTVPEDGLILIEQKDATGTRMVYSGQATEGSQFSRSYSYTGSGSFVIYMNNGVLDEVTYG